MINESRELKVYMLGVGIFACLLRIGLTAAEHINFRECVVCVENTWFDLDSLSSSFWP